MKKTYKELNEQRGKLVDDMKTLLAVPEAEGRTWNAEEKTKYAKMQTDLVALDAERTAALEYETAVAEITRAANENPQLLDSALRAASPAHLPLAPGGLPGDQLSREEAAETFRAWSLLTAANQGKHALSPAHRGLIQKHNVAEIAGMEAKRTWRRPRDIKEAYRLQERIENGEHRALSLTAAAGGYTVPNEAMAEIDIALLLYGAVYRYARVLATDTGGTLPWPTVNDVTNVAAVLTEAAAAGVATDPTFGQTNLGAFMYHSTVVKVSVQLLQDSAVNVPQLLGELLGIRIGRGTNADFTTGAGTTVPFGVVTRAGTASVTQAAANVWTFGELLAIEHSVDPEYRLSPKCIWMMNDKTFLYVKQTKDSQNRPLFLPNMVEGGQAMIDGFPVVINPQVAGGNSGKSILFGDFSKYMVREVSGVQFFRLNELYMGNLQVGFFCTYRADGNLIIAGASGNEPVKYALNHASTV